MDPQRLYFISFLPSYLSMEGQQKCIAQRVLSGARFSTCVIFPTGISRKCEVIFALNMTSHSGDIPVKKIKHVESPAPAGETYSLMQALNAIQDKVF